MVDVVPPALRAAPLCYLFQVVWASRVEVLHYGGVAPVLALCFVFNLGDSQPAWAESKKHRRQQSSPRWAGSAGKPSLHGHGCAAGLKPSADVSARGRTHRSAACCSPLVVPVFLSITAQKRSPKGERRAGVRVSRDPCFVSMCSDINLAAPVAFGVVQLAWTAALQTRSWGAARWDGGSARLRDGGKLS